MKIANVTFDYLFAKKGLLKRLAYLYGSIEPDINVMTYLAGHGDERVRPYILKKLASLSEKMSWGLLEFYIAGRASHYIVDSFTFPHTKAFKGNIKEHVKWEKKLASVLLERDTFLIRSKIGDTIDEIKKEYESENESIENDITYSLSALIILLSKAYRVREFSPAFQLS